MKRISIYHKDREYLLAAAERLALLLKGADVFPADGPDEKGEVYIMEDYMPMPKAAEEISHMLGINVKSGGESVLTGFVSGAGGCGTSSSALMYSGHLADFQGISTAFISLDPLCCKACAGEGPARSLLYSVLFEDRPEKIRELFGRDGRGVCRMIGEGPQNPLMLLSSPDLVRFVNEAARIPRFGASGYASPPGSSEKSTKPIRPRRYSTVTSTMSGCASIRFFPSYDESFTDPYGQLGAEVRELAKLTG